MKKNLLFILSLAFVVIINLYFRTFPIAFPQLKGQAKKAVDKTIQAAIARDVNAKFPQFYPSAREKIIKTTFKTFKRRNRALIRDQVQSIYERFKDKYQNESGQTYIFELDCWHWGRYVENVILYGHPGDETVVGKQWDLLMLAPNGMYLNWEQFLYYFTAFLYRSYAFFRPVPLYTFLFYVPLLFTAVFITVLYLFAFRYGRYIGGIVSSLFVGLSPMFLQRSCAGWFDKDVLNLLFPVLVIWTYLLGFFNASLKHKIGWIAFSSFWVGLFCFTWTHWWFIFFIIIMYESLSIAYLIFTYFYPFMRNPGLRHKPASDLAYFKRRNLNLLKHHVIAFLLFILFSMGWIYFLAGPQPLEILYRQTKQALALTKPLMTSIWPNVYFTVGELRRINIAGMAGSLGGVWIFAGSVLCMVILLLRSFWVKTYPGYKRAAIMILTIWFVSMFFASMTGVRFIVFLLVPLGVSLGWALNDLYEYF